MFRAVSVPPSTRCLLTRAGGFIGHGASDAPGLLGRIPTGIGCFVDLIVGVVASSYIILFGLGDKNVAQPDPAGQAACYALALEVCTLPDALRRKDDALMPKPNRS